jgi:hypothetical protein
VEERHVLQECDVTFWPGIDCGLYYTKSVIIELAGYEYTSIHTNEVQSLQWTNNILTAVSEVQSLQKYNILSIVSEEQSLTKLCKTYGLW